MPRPVGKVGRARQRPVDAGRRDFEPIGALDRVLSRFLERVEPVRNAARQVGAIVDRQLARDRKSVVSGKSVPVRVDLGGCRIFKKKKSQQTSYIPPYKL